jgi:uncharacterized membrane protein YhaH (DUF805 family)
MEEMEATKEWFVTHEGKQFGPVSIGDLKFEVERGELNPRLDMVWKNGMEDWIPAGQLEGLFEKNEGALEEEKRKGATFTEYTSAPTGEEKKRINGEWPGAGRSAFIFICYIFPVLWGFGIHFGTSYLKGKVEPNILGIISMVFGLLPLILAIAVTLKRFQNLGMSRAWFFGLFAPILNLWVWFRIFACPPGYAEHKKLGGMGWVLAILHWASVLLTVAAIVFTVVVLTQLEPEDPYRMAIENYMRDIEEARKAR